MKYIVRSVVFSLPLRGSSEKDARSFVLVIQCMQTCDLDKQRARETANKAKQNEAFHMNHSNFVRMMHV